MQKYIAIQYFTPLAVRKNIVPQKHSEPKMSKQKIGIGKLSEQMFGISNIYLENAVHQSCNLIWEQILPSFVPSFFHNISSNDWYLKFEDFFRKVIT